MHTGDNTARHTLASICARLDSCRSLVLELAGKGKMPDIVERAWSGQLTRDESMQLETLRRGLDGISARAGGRPRHAEDCDYALIARC